MYVVYLAGGIGSGKTTVAEMLVGLGAWRIDLDQLSRDVCRPGSDVVRAIADEFGPEVVDLETGELDRAALAGVAFADPEATKTLEAIEQPAIKEALGEILTTTSCAATSPDVAVVEVPLLDRMGDLLSLADEVVAVVCPLGLRRERAIGRGMTADDFDRRAAVQPTDDYLLSHADSVIENDDGRDRLARQIEAWWERREQAGWHDLTREESE